ncbi:MAG: hypothetical protein A2252_11740 [Elusimicrobia bacterium RIFOXYA2_FULL_39_19]|nr:MAG: hypothetical protein A2252_11740 [Elusimicrobia bacterium RIFOXYA2_FULL_39_19]
MRQEALLNGFWSFITDEKEIGKAKKWFEKAPKEVGDHYVPGCWNLQDPKYFRYEGVAWYFNKFHVSQDMKNKKIDIIFEAVHYYSEVWLNGKYLGKHTGGFTRFNFDITKVVQIGKPNILAVRVDSRLSETTMPVPGSDWFNYSGIVRDVRLLATGKVYCSDIYVKTKIDGRIKAIVECTNKLASNQDVTVTVAICNKELEQVAEKSMNLSVKSNASGKTELDFKLDKPHLWELSDPYLYKVHVSVKKYGEAIDKLSIDMGIREISTRGLQILFNGRPIKIHGVSRHEDHPQFGRTIPQSAIYKDYQLAKDLNANMIRLAHYPHDPKEIEVANNIGMFVMEEIPNAFLMKPQLADKKMLELAKQQLRELIMRDRNNPSIIFWGLAIECETETVPGMKFMKELTELARELDDTRLLLHAALALDKDKSYKYVDVMGVNTFDAWYNDMPFTAPGIFLDRVHKKFPNKPIIFTSHGADSIYGLHSREKVMWSEEFQAEYIQKIGDDVIKRDYLSGECIWHLMDFRVMKQSENKYFLKFLDLGMRNRKKNYQYLKRPGEYNLKGIVDTFRRPKLVYKVVQDLYKRWDDLEKKLNRS